MNEDYDFIEYLSVPKYVELWEHMKKIVSGQGNIPTEMPMEMKWYEQRGVVLYKCKLTKLDRALK